MKSFFIEQAHETIFLNVVVRRFIVRPHFYIVAYFLLIRNVQLEERTQNVKDVV